MTDIALHAHTDVGWVSWNMGRGFSKIHIVPRDGWTCLCGAYVPKVGRVVRDQTSAEVDALCRSCLREFAHTNREG